MATEKVPIVIVAFTPTGATMILNTPSTLTLPIVVLAETPVGITVTNCPADAVPN